MARFYSNENFPLTVVISLRQMGHDVLTSYEAGQANQRIPDEAVVAFATGLGRAVLTLNRRHFHAEHRRSPAHSGIVTCTMDADSKTLAQHIHDQVASLPSLKGLLIKVVRPNS